MTNEKETAVKVVLDMWNGRIKDANALIDGLTDEQLMTEVAPGRNRGIYLLGHLTAVHDRMLPLLDFEKQQYPQLDEAFLTKPDKAVAAIPSAQELRGYWKNANTKLTGHFNKLSPDEWFQKHTAVSAEDFAKEPHRNRLNVVLGRTNHMSSHLGQLVFLKKK
ncbi:MAG TPA: DinB family protein [Bacteroidia bacterium]|jgi:hypothetical protein|nr:DinB family protein [Bacteroidia bacterium]